MRNMTNMINKKPLNKRQKKALARKRKKILLWAAGAMCFVLLISGMWFFSTLPDISSYTYREPSSCTVYSSDGVEIGTIESRTVTYVERDEIPDMLVNAVVSVEDKRFYKHHGVDLISIVRAMVQNAKAGSIVQGGSSITQQLSKLLFFSDEQSYARKLKEAVTAIRMDIKYDKDEIITMYLNEIYLGGGAFGVYEASQTYFHKTPMELSAAECAMLAGIIQAPSAYCPQDEEGLPLAQERKEKVLECMFDQGYLNEEEYKNALDEEITVYPQESSGTTYSYGTCLNGYRNYMSRVYYETVETIKNYYIKTLGRTEAEAAAEAESLVFSNNLTINATLNYEMQENALAAIEDNVSQLNWEAACAYVSVDSLTGNVLCYFGADNRTLLDMADTPRQPGSTIKPLYMLYLLESGKATTDTVVNDAPLNISGYSPGNYGDYYGYVTMRETLVNSLNCGSLQFFLKGNMREEIDFIKTLGISTITEDDYNYAFALGGMSYGIKPAEMASAYGAVASGGMLYDRNYIISVVDESGTVIFPEKNSERKVLSENTASEMKSCLTSVVIRGTADGAYMGYQTYGKTGTTDGARDVWFVGGTGTTVTAVWVGNVDGNYIDYLSSGWCVNTYRQSVADSINEGVFTSSNMQESYSEDTEVIGILKPDSDPLNDITENDVAYVRVLSDRVDNFKSVQVVKVALDSSTGKVFSEKCPEKYKVEKYFLLSEAPEEYCSENHYKNFVDDVHDWFSDWWNRDD